MSESQNYLMEGGEDTALDYINRHIEHVERHDPIERTRVLEVPIGTERYHHVASQRAEEYYEGETYSLKLLYMPHKQYRTLKGPSYCGRETFLYDLEFSLRDGRNVLKKILFPEPKDKINLRDILPAGFKVCWDLDPHLHRGRVNYKEKILYINGDLNNLQTIMILLHETGHCNIIETQEDTSSKNDKGDLTSSNDICVKSDTVDSMHTLLNERNAWAFALRIIRPYMVKEGMGELTRSNVLNAIHNYSLSTYSKAIADKLELIISSEELTGK